MIDLYCGDCLEEMLRVKDHSIDLIITDLPYGTTQCKWDTVIPFTLLWDQYNRIIKNNGAILLFGQQPFSSTCVMSNLKMFRYEWVWQKEAGTGFLNAKKMPLKNSESILVFYKSLPTYNPQMVIGKPYKCKQGSDSSNYGDYGRVVTENSGERYPLNIIRFNRERNNVHPTQKPVALLEYLIRTYSNEGETVLDSCMGSGTTGVAAVNTGRNFIGIEKDTGYFNIARTRIEQARKENK